MQEESISIRTGQKPIESIIGEILVKKHLTIAAAESFTGGLLAGTLIREYCCFYRRNDYLQ